MMNFENLKEVDSRTMSFTLTPIHVTYANTLRRLILTGVETVAFRADMTSTGTTTDVYVKRNDTPMTNEMLADRIGLLPIYVKDPINWNPDKYTFKLHVKSEKDNIRYVKSSDFKIVENVFDAMKQSEASEEEKKESLKGGNADNVENIENVENEKVIPTSTFFPPNPITGDTCLIATLQPSANSSEQVIELVAKATKGTGREHARFCPVSQCSYEYTLDTDERRRDEMFQKWLEVSKKIGGQLDKASSQYAALRREFETMQIKRCYKINEKGEPDSFDFTVETAGVLPVYYIVEQACQVGEFMCSRYVNLATGELPKEISISAADARIVGYDFLVRGHDHTLGNLLQTWLVEHHIEGEATPKVTFAGYKVPHPLRDEMILRIGVEDGKEETARLAFAEAAKGCVEMFQQMRNAWRSVTGAAAVSVAQKKPGVKSIRLPMSKAK
jgi:DNA-directed RNA polymerase subunit L/DNA-directed RNA polymerase alpha subunit